jgi:hypothetical protein
MKPLALLLSFVVGAMLGLAGIGFATSEARAASDACVLQQACWKQACVTAHHLQCNSHSMPCTHTLCHPE